MRKLIEEKFMLEETDDFDSSLEEMSKKLSSMLKSARRDKGVDKDDVKRLSVAHAAVQRAFNYWGSGEKE